MTANLAVALYRAIPVGVRAALWGRWFPIPTSHLYRPGMGWAGIRALTGDSKPPRPKMPHER